MLLPAVGESSLFQAKPSQAKSSQVCLCLDYVWMFGYYYVNKLHLGSSRRPPSVDSLQDTTALEPVGITSILSELNLRSIAKFLDAIC